MLKTLISNVCGNDCKYCPYRSAKDIPRCIINPEQMAALFMEYVRSKQVFGLFLSSGVVDSPDKTMDLLNTTARIARKKYQYRGYIHLKIIPGASDAAIEDALSLASAVSLNIETPGHNHFQTLSEKKDFLRDIVHPIKQISALTAKGMKYERVKQSTQFIVGAAGENDSEIIHYTAGLYERLKLNRVYFSAYQKGAGDSSIPGENQIQSQTNESFIREHRLYQADFLLRKYGFSEKDIIFDNSGRLFYDRDPKLVWAENNPGFFPINVNKAEKSALLRVPGIGPETANMIIKTRKHSKFLSSASLPFKGKRLELAKKYIEF